MFNYYKAKNENNKLEKIKKDCKFSNNRYRLKKKQKRQQNYKKRSNMI